MIKKDFIVPVKYPSTMSIHIERYPKVNNIDEFMSSKEVSQMKNNDDHMSSEEVTMSKDNYVSFY